MQQSQLLLQIPETIQVEFMMETYCIDLLDFKGSTSGELKNHILDQIFDELDAEEEARENIRKTTNLALTPPDPMSWFDRSRLGIIFPMYKDRKFCIVEK